MAIRDKVSDEERQAIQYMLKKGHAIKDIAVMMDRSQSTIRRIANDTNYTEEKLKADQYMWALLNAYWPPHLPERKPKTEKPTKPRTLITPYHYPAMGRTKDGGA